MGVINFDFLNVVLRLSKLGFQNPDYVPFFTYEGLIFSG
jgi:hypothetical protein